MSEPTRTLHEGKWLRLKKRGRWEFVERTNAEGMAVIIIAATPDGNLLFVEQYREPVQSLTIEMPAGLVGDIDASESLELAASRELLEETGWQAEHCEVVLSGPTSSGMSSERVAFVRARGLRRVHAGGGDSTESIVVHEVPIKGVHAWLASKLAEGFALDPKLWAGVWLLDRNADGSPA